MNKKIYIYPEIHVINSDNDVMDSNQFIILSKKWNNTEGAKDSSVSGFSFLDDDLDCDNDDDWTVPGTEAWQ